MREIKLVSKCFECGFRICSLHDVPGFKSRMYLCSRCSRLLPKQENPFLKIAGLSDDSKTSRRKLYKINSGVLNRAVELRKGGMGYQDIAKTLNVSIGIIHLRLQKAMRD